MAETTQDVPAHVIHWQAYLRHGGASDVVFDILCELHKMNIDRESFLAVRAMLDRISDRETDKRTEHFEKYCACFPSLAKR